MGATIENDYILAQAIRGIEYLARKGDAKGFFSALNFMTGQDIMPPKAAAEDFFSCYQDKSEKKPMLTELAKIYLKEKEIDFGAIIEGVQPARVEKLRNTLTLLELCSDPRLKAGISNALWQLNGIREGELEFSPERVRDFMENPPRLSAFDKAAIYFRRIFAKPDKFSGKISFELEGKEKLKLAFAASIDDLAFKYEAFPCMSTRETLHSFFLGVASFISPRKENEKLYFDFMGREWAETLLREYDFNGEDYGRMKAIIGDSKKDGRISEFSYLRMRMLQEPRAFIVKDIVSLLGRNGKIQLNQQTIDNLSLFNIADESDIIVMDELNKILEKTKNNGNSKKAKLIESEIEKIAVSAEPKIAVSRIPFERIAGFFRARNLVTEVNRLAVNFCQNLNGELDCDEAAEFLTRYSGKIFPPFEEEKIIRIIRD